MTDRPPEIRRRRIPRWWIALGVLCVALVAAPFLVRLIQIASVPLVPEPFDVSAAGHVDIGEGENAYDLYRQAAPHFATMPTAVADAYDHLTKEPDPSSIPEELLTFLESQREVLELTRQGSERPEALYYQPDEHNVSPRLHATHALRLFARLAEVEALRLELAGDVGAAWGWHRAVLRTSRHCGMHGCLIERIVGCALYGAATDGVVRWSRRSDVHLARLYEALSELREINKMTVPISQPLQVEYLIVRRTITDPVLRSHVIDDFSSTLGGERLLIEAMFLLKEPDVSQRIARLTFTNWLSQCDLPYRERAATVGTTPELFDVPVGPVSAQELQKLLQSISIARMTLPAADVSIRAHDRDVSRQVLLETALALQIWYREHDEFPESLEPLVGSILETLPIDPFGKGEPIRCRREPDAASGAKIWSIGDDGVDDDGSVDINKANGRKGDVVISVKPPAKPAEGAIK